MNTTIDHIITTLELKPHPEGGFFRETYRSSGEIHPDSLDTRYTGPRNYATCIYFLLTSKHFSSFHRIHQDEIWHFYAGAPILLHIISESGADTKQMIGTNLQQGEVPQFVVPGGSWFAAEVAEPDSYSLIGCTVSPGFSFEDFELGSQKELVARFPDQEALISRLTRD